MKKAQTTTVIIIVLLVVIAIVGVYIAVKIYGSSLTGNIVKEENNPAIKTESFEIVCNSPYIRVGKDCCLDKNNNGICDNEETSVETEGIYTTRTVVVTPPFYVNAWKVTTNGIILELKNNGGEDYVIWSIELSNCGFTNAENVISRDGIETFKIFCSKGKGENFRGDITIRYSKITNKQVTLMSTGTIADKVIA